MKKLVLLVLVAAVASTPAMAAKKKSKKMKAAPAAQTDLNANSRKLVLDALPSFLPGPMKAIYFHNQNKK